MQWLIHCYKAQHQLHRGPAELPCLGLYRLGISPCSIGAIQPLQVNVFTKTRIGRDIHNYPGCTQQHTSPPQIAALLAGTSSCQVRSAHFSTTFSEAECRASCTACTGHSPAPRKCLGHFLHFSHVEVLFLVFKNTGRRWRGALESTGSSSLFFTLKKVNRRKERGKAVCWLVNLCFWIQHDRYFVFNEVLC